MREIKYADAGMDMKKFMLRLIHRCWLLLAAAAAGAVIGAAVYTIVRTVPESEREYRAYSKVYLDFAVDETGEVYQEYNGYTWNDLIATDPILDLTMSNLSGDYSREEVMAATEATILSDLRLLTVTVTTRRAEETDAILAAVDKALESYGGSAKEFVEITTIQTTQAELVVADSRLAQATVSGAVIALAILLFGMLLYDVLDDRIFVTSDVRKVTGMSFLGYAFPEKAVGQSAAGTERAAGQQAGNRSRTHGAGLQERLQTDYDSALYYLRSTYGNVAEVRVSREEMWRRTDAVSAKDVPAAEEWTQVRKADGVVLLLPYGRIHGAFLSYLLEQYQVRGAKVLGIAIADADVTFLYRYYGRAVGRRTD